MKKASRRSTAKYLPSINPSATRLMPMKIEAAVLSGDWEDAKKYGVLNCIECGCCAYNCPAKRPLTQAIRLGKKTIKEKKI